MDGSSCLCPYTSLAIDCKQASLYECNHRFKGVTKQDQSSFTTLKFEKFDYNEESAVKTYFGPHYLHSGVVYGHSSHNYEMMMRRQFALRTDRGYDDWLRGSQEYVHIIDGYSEWLEEVKGRIEKLSPDCDIQTLLYEYVHRPHPKRLIRIRAYEQLRDQGLLEDYEAYCICVTFKLKIPEFAKPGKYPRVIGDFGPAGCLLGGFLLEYAKKAFIEPIEVNGVTLVFVPCPSTPALIRVFRDLAYGSKTVLYLFSDDFCFAFTLPGGRRVMANGDISKCDCSVGDPLFAIAKEVLSSEGMEELAAAVIAQCRKPCILRDRDFRKIIKVQPLHHTLSSGTVLTTFLDNMATSLIGLAMNSVLDTLTDDSSNEEIQAVLETGASFAGFIVTFEICSSYHNLQFLKHSPCMAEDGLLYPVLNMGVVLRTLGQKDGHFPHKSYSDFERRAEQFNSGVVKGFCHMGNHSFHTVLRNRFDAPSAPVYKNFISMELKDYEITKTPYITDDELVTRYISIDSSLELTDYHELLMLTSSARFGDAIDCKASRVILKADYGL